MKIWISLKSNNKPQTIEQSCTAVWITINKKKNSVTSSETSQSWYNKYQHSQDAARPIRMEDQN